MNLTLSALFGSIGLFLLVYGILGVLMTGHFGYSLIFGVLMMIWAIIYS